MSELFNEAFGKVFTKENLSDIPEAKWAFPDNGGIGLCDISFDEASVLKSLEKLSDDKAAGADELVPLFLNLIKQELACPLTILFQSIMACESVPWGRWFQAILYHISAYFCRIFGVYAVCIFY